LRAGFELLLRQRPTPESLRQLIGATRGCPREDCVLGGYSAVNRSSAALASDTYGFSSGSACRQISATNR